MLAAAAACLFWLGIWQAVGHATRGAGTQARRSGRPRRLLTALLSYVGQGVASSSILEAVAIPSDPRVRLRAAGVAPGIGVREWLALKALAAAGVLLFALLTGARWPGRLGVVAVAAAPIAGFLVPDLWLSRLFRRRAEAAVRDLPDMLNLFRVAVAAGQSPPRALGVVAREFNGPLAEEWRRVAAEVALGVPQDRAFAAMARRLPVADVAAFAETLARTRRHGVPLGRIVAAQASRARHRRSQQVRERAARAGPKIQLVVALLLVPAVLLLIAAGLAAEVGRLGLGLQS